MHLRTIHIKLLLSLITLSVCSSAQAQDWTMSTEVTNADGHKYEAFITNDWNDNLFLGIGGGISTRFTAGKLSDIQKSYIDPALNVFLLKWITPNMGFRIGYNGLSGREGLNSYLPYQINHSPLPYKPYGSDDYVPSHNGPGILHYGSFHIYLDFMWNYFNTFFKYNTSRKFNSSFYFSGGYLRVYDNKTEKKGFFSESKDQEFALGIGFYNTFRITERLYATADIRLTEHASRYRTDSGARTFVPTLALGVSYNLHRTTWKKATDVYISLNKAEEAAKTALAMAEKANAQKVEMAEQVEVLSRELQDVKDDNLVKDTRIKEAVMQYEVLKQHADNADLIVYFYINQATLNFSEIHHINNYVESVLKKNPGHIFYILGCADKGTGTIDRNIVLSRARALYVKTYLMNQFGIPEDNIKTESVVTDKHANGALDRCVIFESGQSL